MKIPRYFRNREIDLYLALASVGDVVQQFRPPTVSDFGGGGLRSPIYIDSSTGDAFIFINGAIQPFNNPGGIVSVTAYGARGDGVTNDTNAIRSAVAALRNLGGGILWFPPGKIFKVDVSAAPLGDLTGLNGVSVFGNGSTILSSLVNPAITPVFVITNAKNVRFQSLNFIGGNTALASATGERFIYAAGGWNNLTVMNCNVSRCVEGLFSDGTGTPSYNAVMEECIFDTVYYPFTTYRASNIKASYRAINGGRGVAIGNPASNIEVNIDSEHGGPFTDAIFGINALSTNTVAENTIRNVRLNYQTKGRFSGSGNQNSAEGLIVFNLNQGDAISAAGHFRDISVNFCVDADAANKPANLLLFRRYTAAGSGDNSVRNHTIQDVRINGSALNWQNALEDGIVLFTKTAGGAQDWTGDLITNIAVRDVRIVGVNGGRDSIYYNGQGNISGKPFLTLANVNVDGPITPASATTARVSESNVWASNLDATDGFGTWTPTDGSGAGLGLTINSATWWKRGREYGIYADITYPVTASGANARIDGAPFFGSINVLGSGQYGTLPMNVALNSVGQISVLLPAAGIATNANLSAAIVRFDLVGRLA